MTKNTSPYFSARMVCAQLQRMIAINGKELKGAVIPHPTPCHQLISGINNNCDGLFCVQNLI